MALGLLLSPLGPVAVLLADDYQGQEASYTRLLVQFTPGTTANDMQRVHRQAGGEFASIIPGIGRVKITQLENYFGNLENAWQAASPDLKQAGLDRGAINAITSWRPKISLEAEMEKLDSYGVKAYTWHHHEYPSRLKEIYDYPPVLYVRGSLLPDDEWSIAVVGTRRATVYGRQVTEEIVSDLARNKITIVSGLARGIDSVAHRSALEAGGRSIAVFACGLDTVYPGENATLARDLIQRGALVSEYPLGTRPRADNFPRRKVANV